MSPEDREVLTKQIQVLEETKKLPLIENQCNMLLTEVRSIAARLTTHCEQVIQFRNEIAKARTDLVEILNQEMTGVQLSFLRSANANAREKFKQRYGDDGANLVGFMQGYGKQDSYENLAEVFRKLASLELEQDKWKINGSLLDVKFVDLFNVFDEDDVEIRLDVGNGKFVAIQNLSAGQRCVAVFPLLLRNSAGPLVIDQPEDNLDNRYIADIIAPDLLKKKRHQQFLVTSHNANLVVLTDADLIIHMDSDGSTASFPTSGFFACPPSQVSRSVLDVLDGGERALAARQQKYGVRK